MITPYKGECIHFFDSLFSCHHSLRIGAIFIVLATSAFGTLLPIITGRIKGLGLPKIFYDTVKVCNLSHKLQPSNSSAVLWFRCHRSNCFQWVKIAMKYLF